MCEFVLLYHNPLHVYPGVSSVEFNGAYPQECVYGIAAFVFQGANVSQ